MVRKNSDTIQTGITMQQLVYWDCGFVSHRGAWMSVCWGCCQVEFSATNWSLVQRSPTD